ncbi:MAG TPA: glycoside hydrolase family 28 protein, partial [Longimicrobium sp.]|nr:glycoside hydrolase family 28 protein [Longimicrobium sp.]
MPPSHDVTRRDFLRAAALAGAGLLLPPGLAAACSTPRRVYGGSPWDRVPEILARIRPPRFPDRDFPVTAHGAVGDGTTDATRAIAAAVAACAAAGGGRVVVPAGRFLTGPVHLRGGVNLHLERGATLAFTTDPRAYLPPVLTRWEGVELMGYSPLIYAYGQENVAITGEGTLDGQADDAHWWPWKGQAAHGWREGMPRQNEARARLFALMERGAPVEERVFAEGSYLRPQFIQPYRCRDVLIEGVTIVRSPMWEIHPVLCENVTVRGVTISTHGPNNDGCDPESCRDVLIEGCTFDTGDDCIAIKSGRNADGRRIGVATENVIIRDCVMKDGHGGVTLGSEISGHVRNVFVERCRMDSPNLERAIRFKNNASRGGVLEHVYVRDVTVGEVSDTVLSVDLYYEEGQRGGHTPVVRDVELRGVTSRKSRYGVYMRAYPGSEISGIRVVDSRFDGVERGNVAEGVRDLRFENVRINGQPATATSHTAAPTSDADR